MTELEAAIAIAMAAKLLSSELSVVVSLLYKSGCTCFFCVHNAILSSLLQVEFLHLIQWYMRCGPFYTQL
jgi:hypothetical protein